MAFVEIVGIVAVATGGVLYIRKMKDQIPLPVWTEKYLRPAPSPYSIKGNRSGYVQPMDWIQVSYSKEIKQTGTNIIGNAEFGGVEKRVEKRKKTRYRAGMPTFYVHYRPTDLDARSAPDYWLSILDGNVINDPPDHRPLHFVQTRNMKLYEISEADTAMLNVGPRRQVQINVKLFPSGKPAKWSCKMGVPGGQFPQAPVAPSDEHGASQVQTDEAMRERGNVRE